MAFTGMEQAPNTCSNGEGAKNSKKATLPDDICANQQTVKTQEMSHYNN